jgi:membrane-bound lytic murein transglycosylase D
LAYFVYLGNRLTCQNCHIYAGTKSWGNAIASYNTGQNRVQRYQIASTIRQSRVADFWHLVDELPKETVDYVPKFLAAVIVARNPDRF